MELDYLKRQGDLHKYDHVTSSLRWGKHPQNPVFSIIMPTYQRPEFLKQSVLSAIGQVGVDNYEIVIVDNDSREYEEDPVLEVIRQIHSPKVVYYKNAENIGIYGNTLRAAQLAHGEYAVLLNDDDLLHPYYLQIVSLFMEKYHYYGVIGCMPSEFHEDAYTYQTVPDEIAAFEISEIEYFFGCCVTSPGMLWPVKLTDKIWNVYEPLMMGDQIIQYLALKNYGLYFINFPLALYRIGDNATLQEDRLLDMTYHMCRYKVQIAKKNLFLRSFARMFQSEYLYWYVHSYLQFWNKRKLENEMLKRLHLKRPARYSVKYFLTERIVGQVHLYFVKKHHKKIDKVYLHHKRLDVLVSQGAKRNRFLELLKDYSFEKAYEYARHDKYDLALLGRWNPDDYGEALSMLALCAALKELGNEMLFVNGLYAPGEYEEKILPCFYELGAVSARYRDMDACFALNKVCGTFLIKCEDADLMEQKYYNLRFVEKKHRKIYYNQGLLQTAYMREPVFLQPAKFYREEAGKSEKKILDKFTFCYLTRIQKETDADLKRICRHTDGKMAVYIGKQAVNPDGVILEHAVYGLTIYDFLSYMCHADALVTDSYYGVCLALVLHKPFAVWIQESGSKTECLLDSLGLKNCVADRTNPGYQMQKVNWEHVDARLQEYAERSFDWLSKALSADLDQSIEVDE